MTIAIWLILILSSVLSGACLVQYLTTHPTKMSSHLLGATLATVTALVVIAAGLEGRWQLAALAVGIGGAVAGYVLVAHKILAREETHTLPHLSRKPQDPGLGHTAVIYFAHGEPPTYDPIGWINQFREFDEHGIRFVPFLARPIFLYRLRQAYLEVGASGHRQMHQHMISALRQAFRDSGDKTTRFYLSFLDDKPHPDAAIIQALNEGASRIIISEVFLTLSNHTAEGEALIDELHLERFEIPIRYTGPLWDSRSLQMMFLDRVNANLNTTSRKKAGVLLVGHGQPDEWDELWPSETAQEIQFRQEVLRLFATNGYCPFNLAQAWMEFKEPKPAAQIAEFVRNGVEKIFYFSAAISADALHSQYDLPRLIAKAPIPDKIQVYNLGAWNNDPLVIRAIKEKIDAQML